MDKFLERYSFPRLNQEELENINRQITINDIETVIKNLPTNQSSGPDGFTGEFYQTFREEFTPCGIYMHNGMLLNHKKNEILPFATTWMGLEGVMLSEISRTEKDKYCTLSLTCGI